jgi:dTDP-4-dehydrorhamnose 3,5-epimerase
VIFTETILRGVFIIDPERREDARGFFARTWCERECAAHGLDTRIAQCNVSFNTRKGTLRGLHYQAPPAQEAKLVRCTRGTIHDVVVDVRPDSATFRRHIGLVLSAENRRMLYIPGGCAHGFQTLEDATEVFYQMSEVYAPEHARGVRWNDPTFGIEWPPAARTILKRDQEYPDFTA